MSTCSPICFYLFEGETGVVGGTAYDLKISIEGETPSTDGIDLNDPTNPAFIEYTDSVSGNLQTVQVTSYDPDSGELTPEFRHQRRPELLVYGLPELHGHAERRRIDRSGLQHRADPGAGPW